MPIIKFIGAFLKVFHQGKKISSKGRLHLDVLMERENNLFIAHCLDLDLVAQGETAEEAKSNLVKLINEQIQFAVENDLEQLLVHPAPAEYWKRYWFIKANQLRKSLLVDPPGSKKEIEHKLDVAYA